MVRSARRWFLSFWLREMPRSIFLHRWCLHMSARDHRRRRQLCCDKTSLLHYFYLALYLPISLSLSLLLSLSFYFSLLLSLSLSLSFSNFPKFSPPDSLSLIPFPSHTKLVFPGVTRSSVLIGHSLPASVSLHRRCLPMPPGHDHFRWSLQSSGRRLSRLLLCYWSNLQWRLRLSERSQLFVCLKLNVCLYGV